MKTKTIFLDNLEKPEPNKIKQKIENFTLKREGWMVFN